MDTLSKMLDIFMCFTWTLTYTLVLVGSIKYNYPLISPVAQAIIAPYEFAVVYRLIINGYFGFDYVSFSYLYWTILEIAIIALMLRRGFIQKSLVRPYIVLISCITCVMCYLVAYRNFVFFFSYFNTFIGEIIWFQHIRKKDYPMRPISLMAFIAKFIGDMVSIQVYIETELGLTSIMCVLLPILDFMFIVLYFLRRNRDNSFRN